MSAILSFLAFLHAHPGALAAVLVAILNVANVFVPHNGGGARKLLDALSVLVPQSYGPATVKLPLTLSAPHSDAPARPLDQSGHARLGLLLPLAVLATVAALLAGCSSEVATVAEIAGAVALVALAVGLVARVGLAWKRGLLLIAIVGLAVPGCASTPKGKAAQAEITTVDSVDLAITAFQQLAEKKEMDIARAAIAACKDRPARDAFIACTNAFTAEPRKPLDAAYKAIAAYKVLESSAVAVCGADAIVKGQCAQVPDYAAAFSGVVQILNVFNIKVL